MNKEFKYNAFISYIHNDLDKFVAENLHRLIETYKMPDSVVEKYNINDNNFRRVFRDQDELPLASNLEDPIIEALKESKFLIVICSPRLKESKWCKKEIETFIKLHGRNNILCVLVEGEPDESFPEILRYNTVETITKTGKKRNKKVACEPLAMDVRGKDKNEINKKLKNEVIRVIAPMYNLDYDDIKRRHEERELKRKNHLFKIVAIASFIFALYSIFLFSKIYISSNKLKKDQSINLAEEAHELLAKDNRSGAIEKSYQAVTKYENVKMPITPKGIYELTDSLRVYYPSDNYYSLSQLDTLGVVEHMKSDNDSKYLLSYDESGELVLWDLNSEKRIKTVSDTVSDMKKNHYVFIGEKHYAYINENKEVTVIDLKGNKVVNLGLQFKTLGISSSKNGKYFAIRNENKIIIYETEKYKEIASYEVDSSKEISCDAYFDNNEENIVFAIRKDTYYNGFGEHDNNSDLLTYNISSKNVISNVNLKIEEVDKMLFKDDNVVAQLSRRISSTKSDMVVASYNYLTGKINFENKYDGNYSHDITMAFTKDGTGTILATSSDFIYLLDYPTGIIKTTLSLTERHIQGFDGSGSYRVITSKGTCYAIPANATSYFEPTTLVGMFNFNVDSYRQFISINGNYAAIPNDAGNRIIIYGFVKNDDMKEIEYKEVKDDKISYSDKNDIIDKYNFSKKNLVSNIFYSANKELLFVTYKDKTMEIYDNKTKELVKSVYLPTNSELFKYVAKTKNGEHIIKGYDGYILDKNFDIIAFVPNLYDYHDGKLVLSTYDKYYKVIKEYSAKEIIGMGKDYLKKTGRLSN